MRIFSGFGRSLFLALLLAGATRAAGLPRNAVSGLDHAPKGTANPKEIVFIHGMFVTPKCWEGWESYFRERGYAVSAPAWPLHEGEPAELRTKGKLEALGRLELEGVLERYRELLRAKAVKPILVGHSMGGLVAQILLSEGLAQAAVAIDSAPPKGRYRAELVLRSRELGRDQSLADADHPIELSLEQFSYAFLNAQAPESRPALYDAYYVPESRRVGKAPTQAVARIDAAKARGPLLLVAGGADHIIPARLNHKNFRFYAKTPGYTEFLLCEGRDHWTLAGAGWERVAEAVDAWLKARF